jgi:hypothetical protein
MTRPIGMLAFLALSGLAPAHAQDSAQFYKGRNVTIIVGSP